VRTRTLLAAIAKAEVTIDDDAEQVARYRRGENRAFDVLVKKYQRPIFYLALRYVRNPDDAKDVAQRAFVRAFRSLDGFRGDASFKTWLYKIAVNMALNHLRDHARERPAVIDEAALTTEAVGASGLTDQQDRLSLLRALAELPPKQRLVVELRVFEELPFKDVAEIAECSENSAKVNFHHAVKRLREVMGAGPGEKEEPRS
jgi:RNA polymerase sigma-70 factor (ECF subfamily)